MTADRPDPRVLRAQGCLLGQFAGDALGSQVEFMSPTEIRTRYPNGVRDLVGGGTWDTLAGQPTDDSEMALALARALLRVGTYDPGEARQAYGEWLRSEPFDCGNTVRTGLLGSPNVASQANGALMRVSPLGIFGANHDLRQVAEWARQDAEITHPNPVCLQTNALFAMAVAHAVRTGCSPMELYEQVQAWAAEMGALATVRDALAGAALAPPADYMRQQGWVLIAFRNAFWQLLHAPNLEEGVVDTVLRGGDTDTNACIAGALLGAVHGRDAAPGRWVSAILHCRPEAGRPGVHRPRPRPFWPTDALTLGAQLLLS